MASSFHARSIPGRDDRLEHEGDPWHQPHSKQAPEQHERDGVVVPRNPPVEIAEHLFIDEIKPEEPVHVAGCGNGPGVSLRWIGNACCNMPRQRDQQEDQQAGKRVPAPQVAQIPIEQQEDDDNGEGENNANEPLGEHVEGTRCGKAPGGPARRLCLLKRDPEQQHGQRKPQADDDIGNDDARVNENAEGGQQYQGGIEAGGIGREQAASRGVYNQKQGQCGESQRQPSGPILRPEESEAGCHAPVHEWGLFEIADAIGVEGNPVMARDHFPRNLGMHRVGIIQQRRAEERKACVEQEPEAGKREDYFPRTMRDIRCDGGLQGKTKLAENAPRRLLLGRSLLLSP